VVTLVGSVFAIVVTFGLYTYVSAMPSALDGIAGLMRVDGVDGVEVLVVALGYSAAIMFQVLVLFIAAVRTFSLPASGLAVHGLKALCAAIVGGACAYSALNFFVFGINETAALGILLQGFFGGVIGMIGAAATYYVLRTPEMTEIYKSFKGRIFKTDVVAVQDEIL